MVEVDIVLAAVVLAQRFELVFGTKIIDSNESLLNREKVDDLIWGEKWANVLRVITISWSGFYISIAKR